MGCIYRVLVASCLVALVAVAPVAATATAATQTADGNTSSAAESDRPGVADVADATGEVVEDASSDARHAVEGAEDDPRRASGQREAGRSDAGLERRDAADGGDAGLDLDVDAGHPPRARLLSLAASELSRLAVADPTLEAPSPVPAASPGPVETRSPPERTVDDGETVADGTPARTPDAANGSAVDGDASTGASTATDGAGGFDPAASLAVAPSLGTALLAVAARPWVGLLSGAASGIAGWFGRAFVLFRYRSRDGSDPLEHETRARIHDLVAESPGRTLSDLSTELDTPLSTVRHHVKILERERVVVTRKLRGNRRLYPLGAENAELVAALREDSSAAVLAALHEQGRATVGDVVDRVEKSYSTVSYHLSRLADEGLVVQEREGRTTVSRLDPAVESLLDAPDEPRCAGAESAGREASAD